MLRLCYCFYDCDSRRRASEGAPAAHSSIEETLLVVGVESLLRLYTLRCGLLLFRQNLYASHQMRQAESVESRGDARYDTFSRLTPCSTSQQWVLPQNYLLPNYYPPLSSFFSDFNCQCTPVFWTKRGKKYLHLAEVDATRYLALNTSIEHRCCRFECSSSGIEDHGSEVR